MHTLDKYTLFTISVSFCQDDWLSKITRNLKKKTLSTSEMEVIDLVINYIDFPLPNQHLPNNFFYFILN